MTENPYPTPTEVGLALLADGVPLSLLLDLAVPVDAHELYRDEPGDTRWVPSLTA